MDIYSKHIVLKCITSILDKSITWLIWEQSAKQVYPSDPYLFEIFTHTCFRDWGPFGICRLAVVVLHILCKIFEKTCAKCSHSKQTVVLFLFQRKRKKTQIESFYYNKWMTWVAITHSFLWTCWFFFFFIKMLQICDKLWSAL